MKICDKIWKKNQNFGNFLLASTSRPINVLACKNLLGLVDYFSWNSFFNAWVDRRQTYKIFYCIFLVPDAQNVEKKSFTAIGEKKKPGPYHSIWPSGLRTYEKFLLHIITPRCPKCVNFFFKLIQRKSTHWHQQGLLLNLFARFRVGLNHLHLIFKVANNMKSQSDRGLYVLQRSWLVCGPSFYKYCWL